MPLPQRCPSDPRITNESTTPFSTTGKRLQSRLIKTQAYGQNRQKINPKTLPNRAANTKTCNQPENSRAPSLFTNPAKHS